jgi:hypothetical protein
MFWRAAEDLLFIEPWKYFLALFYFILSLSVPTYIHSHIHTIKSSVFIRPRPLSIFFIASSLSGKNLPGLPSRDLKPAHYQLCHAAPKELPIFIGKFWFTYFQPVWRIHDILVWILIRMRIRGSMPLTSGSGSFYFHHWPSIC